MAFLSIFLLVAIVLGISFIMMNIRTISTGEPFRGTCASASPYLKEELGECTCNDEKKQACKNGGKHYDFEKEVEYDEIK